MKTHFLLFFLAICVYGHSQTEVVYTLQDDDLIGWDVARIDQGTGGQHLNFHLSTNGTGEIVVFCTNENDAVQWAKNMAIISGAKPRIVADGKKYIYVASRSDDVVLAKMTYLGKLIWLKKLDWGNSDEMRSMEFTNNRLMVAGVSSSLGNSTRNPFILNLDTSGNVTWSTTFNRSGIDGNCTGITIGKSHYLCGNTTTNAYGKDDVFLAKVDGVGSIIWYKHFGTTLGEGLHSICEKDGILYAGGVHTSASGNKMALVAQADTSGNLLNTYTYDGNGTENVNSMQSLAHHILATGKIGSGGKQQMIFLLNSGLKVTKASSFSGDHKPVKSAAVNLKGGYQLATNTSQHSTKPGTYQLRLDTQKLSCNESKVTLTRAKYSPSVKSTSVSRIATKPTVTSLKLNVKDVSVVKKNVCLPTGQNPVSEGVSNPISIYPNPSDHVLIIEGKSLFQVTLITLNGKEIYHQKTDLNQHKIDVTGLPSGIYLAHIKTNSGDEVRKVLVRH